MSLKNDTYVGVIESFLTFESCMNFTQNCYSHGSCIGKEGLFYCYCDTYYDIRSMCSLNFFEEIKGVDMWYWILGLVFSIFVFVFLTLEALLDIRFLKHGRPNFQAKLFLLAYCITKFIHYGIRASYTITEKINPPSFVEGIVNLFTYAAWMGSYNIVLLVWLGLYIRLSAFSKRDTSYFDNAKIVLKVVLCVYVILIIILIIFFTLPIQENIATFIYLIFTAVYLLVLMLWSSYHCFKIHTSVTETSGKMKSTEVFLRKNKIIAALNLVLFLDLITFILNIVADGLFITPVGNLNSLLIVPSLVNDAINFVIEWFAVFLMVSILQTYSLLGKNPCKLWLDRYTGPTPPASVPSQTKPTTD